MNLYVSAYNEDHWSLQITVKAGYSAFLMGHDIQKEETQTLPENIICVMTVTLRRTG